MSSDARPEHESERTYKKIDHIAIAVRDLEEGIKFFTETLGFSLMRRLHVHGLRTGMISAELEHHQIKFVLCQGTEPESQVSQLIAGYGPGVGHIALEVDDVESVVANLERQGATFDTDVIKGPGLTQAFSSRDPNSGLSFEFIKRTSEQGFLAENVQQLFDQLEKANTF